MDRAGSGENQQVWTAAKESRCPGKFEWCSTKLFFPLRKALVWKKEATRGSCAYIEFGKGVGQFQSPLGKADCSERKNVICEVSMLFSQHSKYSNFHFASRGQEQRTQAKRLQRNVRF